MSTGCPCRIAIPPIRHEDPGTESEVSVRPDRAESEPDVSTGRVDLGTARGGRISSVDSC